MNNFKRLLEARQPFKHTIKGGKSPIEKRKTKLMTHYVDFNEDSQRWDIINVKTQKVVKSTDYERDAYSACRKLG